MSASISTVRAARETVHRLSPGVDLVTWDGAPARLPGEQPSPGSGLLVGRKDGEYVFVGVRGPRGPVRAGSVTRWAGRDADGGRTVRTAPGDIVFYDVRGPWRTVLPEGCRVKVFLVPRELLGLDEADVRRVTAEPVARDSRLGPLLSPFLSELADTAASAPPPVGDLLAWNGVNLLATLAAERLGRGRSGAPARPSPLMGRIFEYIDRHLADAGLAPEGIAAAHHISVRYLHKLFQEEGTTVGRWIQRRRLEECRRDLVLRGREHQTIAAVAGRWGFVSATHFSRVFRAAYGVSPSAWRDGATAGAVARG
jgi:AraC-like DNA-binding protein